MLLILLCVSIRSLPNPLAQDANGRKKAHVQQKIETMQKALGISPGRVVRQYCEVGPSGI